MASRLPKKSGIYDYARLINLNTKYAVRMKRLSNRIFHEAAETPDKKSQRVINSFASKPLDLNRMEANYYPNYYSMDGILYQLRMRGLYRDEYKDFKEEMRRIDILRGKKIFIVGDYKKSKD